MAEALPVDRSTLLKLVRLVNLTARPFSESIGRQHQLTLTEWRVMVVLASHPGAAATDVVDSTGLDKMSVSRALASLESKGRVLRKPHPADQRKSSLQLSPEGRRLFQRIGRLAQQREAQLLRTISPGELQALNATLDKLVEALRGEGAQADP